MYSNSFFFETIKTLISPLIDHLRPSADCSLRNSPWSTAF